jgi:D-alanyl-D-alanine carboxypeptidase/D-alanyl-D-alanine-endopeptidase (penicillin-binding protein 4)
MTDFLIAESKSENFEFFRNNMANPGIGTLENRMLYFGNNVKAKTGTLSDVSAIAGYIKTRRGNDYAFDIMINDSKSDSDKKKMAEETILRTLYLEY